MQDNPILSAAREYIEAGKEIVDVVPDTHHDRDKTVRFYFSDGSEDAITVTGDHTKFVRLWQETITEFRSIEGINLQKK